MREFQDPRKEESAALVWRSQAVSKEKAHYFTHSKFLLVVATVLSTLPFLLNLQHFRRLFWFGDEIQILSEISKSGFSSWLFMSFGENAIPLFKLLWGGSVFLFHGSYFSMMMVLWATHLLNVWLLGRLLLAHEIKGWPLLVSLVIFGMSASTHESLGWSVQLCVLLVYTFFLSALCLAVRLQYEKKKRTLIIIGIFLCCMGAAFSFVRGIMVCGVVSFYLLLSTKDLAIFSRVRLASLTLIPAIIAATMIVLGSGGNHQHLFLVSTELWRSVAEFALYFFSLNPLYRIFSDTPATLTSVLLCGLIKGGIYLCAWRLCQRQNSKMKPLLLTLLLLDLGNTALVSVGRYHTGAPFACSSRYQYEALLIFAGFLCVLLSAMYRRDFNLSLRLFGAGLLPVMILFFLFRWDHIMSDWGKSRGKEGRAFYFGKPGRRPETWWGLPPSVSRLEAERVITLYNLH